MIRIACHRLVGEIADRLIHRHRLVGDQDGLDAEGQAGA
jgi:hypothetical protein